MGQSRHSQQCEGYRRQDYDYGKAEASRDDLDLVAKLDTDFVGGLAHLTVLSPKSGEGLGGARGMEAHSRPAVNATPRCV